MKQGHGGFAREGGEISCLVAAVRQFLGAQFQRFKQKYLGQNRKKQNVIISWMNFWVRILAVVCVKSAYCVILQE